MLGPAGGCGAGRTCKRDDLGRHAGPAEIRRQLSLSQRSLRNAPSIHVAPPLLQSSVDMRVDRSSLTCAAVMAGRAEQATNITQRLVPGSPINPHGQRQPAGFFDHEASRRLSHQLFSRQKLDVALKLVHSGNSIVVHLAEVDERTPVRLTVALERELLVDHGHGVIAIRDECS